MSHSEAKAVISNQQGPHEKLEATVRRHLDKPFRRPFPDYSLQAFAEACDWLGAWQGPLIFDSYCGVGESTARLAQRHPQAKIIGLDKSLFRLNKHEDNYRQDNNSNYLLLRADVDDFWRQALEAGWQLSHHYLLYPNPWPKSSQLKRRVQGSPLLPTLLALGGQLELRSNWPVYVDEFAQALCIAGHQTKAEQFDAGEAITPFERKYQLAQQPLWRCVHNLDTL